MIRFNLVFIPGLAAGLSLAATATLAQAQPAGASAELARLFQMVCMRDDFSPENTAKLREARNWTLDRKLSGEQGKGSSQKTIVKKWIVEKSKDQKFMISVSSITNRKTNLEVGAGCTVQHEGELLREILRQLPKFPKPPSAISAPPGKFRMQWTLKEDPLDTVFFYSDKTSGGQVLTSVVRGKVLQTEKQLGR